MQKILENLVPLVSTKKKWLIFLPAAMAGLSTLSPFIETLKSEDDALLITYSSAISGDERKLVPAVGEAAKEVVVAKRETGVAGPYHSTLSPGFISSSAARPPGISSTAIAAASGAA